MPLFAAKIPIENSSPVIRVFISTISIYPENIRGGGAWWVSQAPFPIEIPAKETTITLPSKYIPEVAFPKDINQFNSPELSMAM